MRGVGVGEPAVGVAADSRVAHRVENLADAADGRVELEGDEFWGGWCEDGADAAEDVEITGEDTDCVEELGRTEDAF